MRELCKMSPPWPMGAGQWDLVSKLYSRSGVAEAQPSHGQHIGYPGLGPLSDNVNFVGACFGISVAQRKIHPRQRLTRSLRHSYSSNCYTSISSIIHQRRRGEYKDTCSECQCELPRINCCTKRVRMEHSHVASQSDSDSYTQYKEQTLRPKHCRPI
jgi:hypothetical protein